MAKIHNPKSRQKPTCATCWHQEPSMLDDAPGGICHGVPPTVVMKDGQVLGAFPPVKLSWRCPNWQKTESR